MSRSRSTAMLLLMLTAMLHAQGPREAYDRGETLLRKGDQIAAIAEFRSSVEQNPQYLDAWVGLAEAFLQMQELDQALSAVERARDLAGSSLSVRNLHADVLLSLGEVDSAEAIYAAVLEREPNNTDAVIGRAQIALARNQPRAAAAAFSQALERSPRNRSALLSLAIIATAERRFEDARVYINSALQHHNDSAVVHYIAARQYYKQNDTEQAAYHVATAISLRDQYVDALLLQAEISLKANNPVEARAVMQQLLEHDSEVVQAWYNLAIAEHLDGNSDTAIEHLERGLRLQPGNEYVRIAYETILRSETELDDPRRQTAAGYHLDVADGYHSRNLAMRARSHFRRALQLSPFSERARRGFAEGFKDQELFARYVDEMKLLWDQGVRDQDIEDAIEIYSNYLLDSPAQEWGISQFDLERMTVGVQLFMVGEMPGYPRLERYLPDYVQDVLSSDLNIDFTPVPDFRQDATEAFQAGRSAGSDYYLLIHLSPFDNGVQMNSELMLSRTGSSIFQDMVIREGAQPIRRALWSAGERLSPILPLQARLVDRRFRTGVIDRGAMHGLKAGDELTIYPARSGIPRSDGPGLLFPTGAEIGVFEVENADDSVAVGRITGGGFFDRVDIGDVAVRQPEDVPDAPVELDSFPQLYRQIRALD